jgi:hypothetical protein
MRFRVDGIVVSDKPIEIYLDGVKIAEVIITIPFQPTS